MLDANVRLTMAAMIATEPTRSGAKKCTASTLHCRQKPVNSQSHQACVVVRDHVVQVGFPHDTYILGHLAVTHGPCATAFAARPAQISIQLSTCNG